MNIQRTVVMIHCEGVQRRLIGEVISRIERKGLKINAMKLMIMLPLLVKEMRSQYGHESWFQEMENRVIVTPYVILIVSGHEAIKAMLNLIGSLDDVLTAKGTIQGDFNLINHSLIHSSDSEGAANWDITHLFSPSEIYDYPMVLDGNLFAP